MPRRYTDLDPGHQPHGSRTIFRWLVLDRLAGRRAVAPAGPPAQRVQPDLHRVHARSPEPRLTWIGHSSFLGTLDGRSFLVDPIFSQRAGYLYSRHVPAGLQPADLPTLDALLITHSHYDHLDAASVRRLERSVPVFAPAGLGEWFERRGFVEVVELNWWETVETEHWRITFVPARHWSRRAPGDTNRSLWGGFVIEGEAGAFYHAGDTGMFDGFEEIGQRFPRLTAAMLPIGSYAPEWFMRPNHLDPEQAAQAFLTLGARNLVPMHWGTFKLTDESLQEPADRLERWWQLHQPKDRWLHRMAVGQTVAFDRA